MWLIYQGLAKNPKKFKLKKKTHEPWAQLTTGNGQNSIYFLHFFAEGYTKYRLFYTMSSTTTEWSHCFEGLRAIVIEIIELRITDVLKL